MAEATGPLPSSAHIRATIRSIVQLDAEHDEDVRRRFSVPSIAPTSTCWRCLVHRHAEPLIVGAWIGF